MQIKVKNLPEEIILKIFSEFDNVELRKLLGLSLEWRNLLIRNVEVMRKLPVILNKESWREKLEFLRKNGNFVRKIRFDETVMDNFEELIEIFSMTPNLESAEFKNVRVKDEQMENPENPLKMIYMEKLRHLTIIDDSETFSTLKFLSNHFQTNLRSLMFELSDQSQSSYLISILQSNKNLKSLEISSRLDEIFNPSDDVAIDNLEMRLSSIKVTSNLIKHNYQLVKFLELQNELKEVEFQSRHIDFRYYELLLEKHQNLQSLHINIDILASDDCLRRIRELNPNKSVRNLHITGENRHLNVFESLIYKFPRLNRLVIDDLTQFYTDKLCRLLSLTYLLIGDFSANFMRLVTDGVTSKTTVHLKHIQQSHREFYEQNIHNFGNLRIIDPVNDEKTRNCEILSCN